MRKMQFLKPLTLSAFVALVGMPSAQKTAAAQQTPGPTTSSEKITLAEGPPQLVTPAYLRMHYPEMLVNLAQQVSTGGAPKTSLVKLAGANFTESLLKANFAAIPPPPK